MDLRYLFADRPFGPEEQLPCDKGLDILSGGQHMYGYAFLPGGRAGEKSPCVILLHGLPGYTQNQDIGQALRRLGFVVMHLFYRGAWGSQGNFSLTGMVQDVESAVRWCGSRDASDIYGIDGDGVFLLGISMGGWAAIHGLCLCPQVKGAVAIAPADIGYLNRAQPQLFENAYRKYGCLRIETPEALPEEAARCQYSLGIMSRTDALKDRPLLMIGGSRDTVVPPENALVPFWKALQQDGTKEFIVMDAGHSFADCRMELTRVVARWLSDRI